jgi:hypothetical protein
MYFEEAEGEITVSMQPLMVSALAITTVGTFVLGILPFILENLVQDATLAMLP